MERPDHSKEQSHAKRSLSVETTGFAGDSSSTLQSLKAHIQRNVDLCRMINSPEKSTISGDNYTLFGSSDRGRGATTSFEDAPPPSPIESVMATPSYEASDHTTARQFGEHFSSEFSAFNDERVTKVDSADYLKRLTEDSTSDEDESFVDSVLDEDNGEDDESESEQVEDYASSFGTNGPHSVVFIPPLEDSPVDKEKLVTRQFSNHHSATFDIVHQIKQHVVGVFQFL
jgi:hypothetical protein